LSSANDALRAIRKGKVIIGNQDRTNRAETIAELMQAATLMVIALNYDRGYIIDENSDLTALTRVSRKAIRDSALKLFDATIALASAGTWATTESGWANGLTYTPGDLGRIANTMAAMLLVYYPRDDAETATAGVVDW